MSRSTVKFNDAFFAELANSAPVEGLLRETANRVAERARATAPVRTGAYRRGIVVRIVPHRRIRAVALVVGTDRKTMLIESRRGTLARALKASTRGR